MTLLHLSAGLGSLRLLKVSSKDTYSSIRAFQADSCTDCQLTVYSDNAFGGKSQNFNLNNIAESALEFCAKSLVLECPDLGPQLPQPGEQLSYQKISPVVYTETYFMNVMNAGITLTLNKAIAEGQITSWPYWVTNIRQVDRSVDYDYLHRYDVYIINNLGDNYHLQFEISDHPDLPSPLLLSSSVAPWY